MTWPNTGKQNARISAESGKRKQRRTTLLASCVIFLVALNLRPAIVAVGPLLSSIGSTFGWGESLQGLLGALPLLAFALFSIFVSAITAKLSTDKVLFWALVVLAGGCVLRSFFGEGAVWAGTLLIGASIAVGNVLAPAIVKRDFIDHVSFATGAYSACVTSGSALAGLTASAAADALGGWQPALALWAVPALLAAALWAVRSLCGKADSPNKDLPREAPATESKGRASRNNGRTAQPLERAEALALNSNIPNALAGNEGADRTEGRPSKKTSTPTTSRGDKAPSANETYSRSILTENAINGGVDASDYPTAMHDHTEANNDEAAAKSTKPQAEALGATRSLFRRRTTWLVTLFMGLQSAAFYTFCNWLPSIAASAGFAPAEAGVQLFIFQALGILSGLVIPRFMYIRGGQTCAALMASVPLLVASLGWLAAPQLSLLWSVFGGIGQGASLVVALTLISLRGRGHAETVALSGIAQSLGYLLAACGPFIFGALAEATGAFAAPLAFMAALAAAQCILSIPAGKQ